MYKMTGLGFEECNLRYFSGTVTSFFKTYMLADVKYSSNVQG